MRTKVQYSPDPELVGAFITHPFVYSFEHATGRVISTMTRIRSFLEKLGIIAPSRNIILAILEDTGGKIIGTAVNTYNDLSTICVLHVEAVKKRVEKALQNKELLNMPKNPTKSMKALHKHQEHLPDSTQYR
jgi:hypothetical protein